ncbi:MAG: NAD/NADP octopine/nopaline dehydrogenase family protein [Ilumatobacteraceae bacterium]
MKVTVLGSGNGGLAIAYDWASNGHHVALYARSEHANNIAKVRLQGGINATGRLDGFAPVTVSTTDIAEAMDGTETLFVCGPAFATESLAADAAPHLRPGMTVIVCPSSCVGSLAFKRAARLDPYDDSIVVGETNTLPYAARATGGGNVHIFHKFDTGFWAAAAPRSGTERLLEVMRQVYPDTQKAATVFQTTLQNGNPVIHPAVTLLNAALIERAGGAFKFYEEGITPATGHLMQAVDCERLRLADALGVPILSEPDLGVEQGYMTVANYTTGYSQAPGYRGIMAPDRLDNRYLTEDVGFTMLFFTDLANKLGVPTPVMNAIIEIASIVLHRDLRGENGRTLERLGLARLTAEELIAY